MHVYAYLLVHLQTNISSDQQLLYTICLRVDQDHNTYGVYTVFLAGKSPNIRSHTVLVNPTCVWCVCLHVCTCS